MEFADHVDLARVDVDVLADLAMQYKVTSIPLVMTFSSGTNKSTFVGVKDKQFLTDFVKNLIDNT